jgi:hypothetical protein
MSYIPSEGKVLIPCLLVNYFALLSFSYNFAIRKSPSFSAEAFIESYFVLLNSCWLSRRPAFILSEAGFLHRLANV